MAFLHTESCHFFLSEKRHPGTKPFRKMSHQFFCFSESQKAKAKGKQSGSSVSMFASYQAAKAYQVADAAFVSGIGVDLIERPKKPFDMGCVFI